MHNVYKMKNVIKNKKNVLKKNERCEVNKIMQFLLQLLIYFYTH